MAANTEPTPSEQTGAGADDPKEQFRLALERKKRQATDSVGQTRHGESPHGATDTHQHGGRREFRRKAGG
jgi:hypothetical protein